MSSNNFIKLSNPTKVLLGEYPPHLYNDILKMFTVGNSINTKNKMTEGATQKNINADLPLFFISISCQENGEVKNHSPFLILTF